MIEVPNPPEYASTAFFTCCFIVILQNRYQDSFLGGQSIGSLVKRERVIRVHDGIRHFKSAVRGKAVHEIRVFARFCHQCIVNLIGLRRQLIDDVYQITGLSDIMRGETDAQETLGAQQLKSQYGSIRVKERQGEMTRIARDRICIAVEALTTEVQGRVSRERGHNRASWRAAQSDDNDANDYGSERDGESALHGEILS